MNPTLALKELQNLSRAYLPTTWLSLADIVLMDKRFATQAGGCKHHHVYKGGLVVHTLEVAKHVLSMTKGDNSQQANGLMAAIWHDYGKIHEYVSVEIDDGSTEWINTDFSKKIGHLVWSWSEFYNDSTALSVEDRLDIGHAILAHHGRREWGSAKDPQTKLAFILHTADMLSMKEGSCDFL